MENDFLGKKILFVIAHPDDESYLAAGTIRENKKAGGESYILCATLGEKGKSHLKKEVTQVQLKRIRKQELLAVSKLLKVKKVLVLSLPDTGVAQHKKALHEKLLSAVLKIKPEVIVGFGPDGISGHHDHIAAGEVALRVAKKFKLPYLAFTRPPKLQTGKAKHWFRRRRKHGLYVEDFEYAAADYIVPIEPAIKRRALLKHKSQIEGKDLMPGIPRSAVQELLRIECFVKLN